MSKMRRHFLMHEREYTFEPMFICANCGEGIRDIGNAMLAAPATEDDEQKNNGVILHKGVCFEAYESNHETRHGTFELLDAAIWMCGNALAQAALPVRRGFKAALLELAEGIDTTTEDEPLAMPPPIE